MPVVTLPDGKKLEFENTVTIADVAKSIGPGLLKVAVAGKINGEEADLSRTIESDCDLSIIRAQDPEGLEIIRHSTAHILAQAMKRLYPDAQLAIGPVIEDGFYYDLDYKETFSESDLDKIEAKMQEIIEEDLPVTRLTMTISQAIEFYKGINESYKVEILEGLEDADEVSFYRQGEFTDLCRGPHIPSTGAIKAFKLMKLAGAYWRGDSDRPMLQRIYGTAWQDKKALKKYLHRLEEAAKRDHRLLAKKMDLFHIQEESPGMAFWHPRGWELYRNFQLYLHGKLKKYGYQEIRTPELVDRSLWEASGHWEKFRDDMFVVESENRDYVLKPMNCPCHVQVFKQGLTSYRDLPIRLAEFGSCHRNEASGTLHGLFRVRNFVQDDAHIFCTEDQMLSEITDFIKLLQEVYTDFGFDDIIFYLSTRPEKRIGSDEVWDKAEGALAKALEANGLDYEIQPEEGAFYGPKVEFQLRDSLGRKWQCGTVQIDFFMPERLGAYYINEEGEKAYPVMIHRAIFGSLERFLGILLEEYSGNLPLWIAPTQVAVFNISDAQADYCKDVVAKLEENGLRVELDLRNEKIGYKIREHTIKRVPYLLVIGDKEMAAGEVAVRTQSGEDLGVMKLEDFVARAVKEIEVKHFAKA